MVLVAAAVVIVGPAVATASALPIPDRDDVEAAFEAAMVVQIPAVADSLLPPVVACFVEERPGGALVCFGQYVTPSLEIYLVQGLAPERDPVDGPPIEDPAEWPWEIVSVALPAI